MGRRVELESSLARAVFDLCSVGRVERVGLIVELVG